MKTCSGAPAERFALAYVEGTLAQSEAECFEEHYFECPVCLEYLQALQAAGLQLERNPVEPATALSGRADSWRKWGWAAAGAAAAILLIVFAGQKALQPRNAPAATAASGPVQAPAAVKPAEPAVERDVARLADLAMPAYVALALRGEVRDDHFEAGMDAYQKGSCGEAIAELALVARASRDALAARFYLGACQMHEQQLDRAAATLRSVAAAGDSSEQEASLYYLAQIALDRNQVAPARTYLSRVIALHGDFEARARSQQHELAASTAQQNPSITSR